VLNHDLAKYFLGATTMIIAGGCWLMGWNWLWCLLPLLVFLSNVIYGSFNIQANYHIKSINGGPKNSNKIALTFDDGPSEFTPRVLDILKENGIQATFFCIGSELDSKKEIAVRAHLEGHVLCNHSYHHSKTFGFASTKKVYEEIEQTNDEIRGITNQNPRWFRPPYGVTNPNIKKALTQSEMTSIGWNNRSLDTLKEVPEKVVQRVLGRLKGGDIVLFHDSHNRIRPILEQFLKELEKTELKIVSLEELIDEKAYS